MSFFTLNQLPLYTDEIFLTGINDIRDKDTIVIFNPADSLIVSPVFLRSRKSLDEHIRFIKENKIKKAIVVGEDIHFLRECPELEYIKVFPAITAEQFDYSPLYEMPCIKWLSCETMYGKDEEKVSNIDYKNFKTLTHLGIKGAKGHNNVNEAGNIISLWMDFGFPKEKTLKNVIPGKELKRLSINQSPIQSLEGIEVAEKLERLDMSYNRGLKDISQISEIKNTLAFLEISKCGKVQDFSVLNELHNLEYLILEGTNVLPNLNFLKKMPNLKYLRLTMNVADGDLSLCEKISCVDIKNRKHFSHKDKDLPKNFINLKNKYSFN